MYSKIDYQCTSEQADRDSPPSRAYEGSEEENLYCEIAVCPLKEEEQHQPQEHSSSHPVKQNSVYCTVKAIDILPVAYHTILTQTTKERN